MAYLLGAEAVMESLQTDVRDIQSCVADIISRTGPVQCSSWKFPDKKACDLNIEDLLDLYSYSEDEEERQVAHIALYELVIDRLLLLMQGASIFTDQVLKVVSVEGDIATQPATSTSIGVVIKKYWNKMTKMRSVIKQTISEKNAASRKVEELEQEIVKLNTELKQNYDTKRPKTAGFGGLIPPNRAELALGRSLNISELKQFGIISKDEYNKSCQTAETAFTPCDSCSIVQKSFRQSGEIIVNICQQQQIPSCLQKFRPQVSHLDWLSGNDVSRWSAEQNKDLQRISKLTATIQPMKQELKEYSDKCEKLEKRVTNFDRDMKREKDERSALHHQYEMKIKELEIQHTKTLELEHQQKELLMLNKQELERLLEKHKSELQEQQRLLQNLETKEAQLKGELSSNKTNMAEVKRLEREMTDLQGKLDEISAKMEHSSKELQREQMKNRNASKHSESLQTKQESLLNRIDTLDRENTDLKEQISSLEEEKDQFEEQLGDREREITAVQKKLKEKQSEIEHVLADKESLEQTIGTLEVSLETLNEKLEAAKERERLIVEYPDINGPVNPDLTGTGDIVVDMENQVKANNIRIELLEKQNNGLRNSISKLIAMQQPPTQQQRWATYVTTTGPQQLWNPNYLEGQSRDTITTELGCDSEIPNQHLNTYIQRKVNNIDRQNRNTNHNIGEERLQTALHTLDINASVINKKPDPRDSPPKRPLTGSKSKLSGDEIVVGRISHPESAKSKRETVSLAGKSRPNSGKAVKAPVNASSISAYLQLKKAGKLNLNPDIKIGASSSGPTDPVRKVIATEDLDYRQQDNFTCEKCDKMYSRARDLDIHMSYCTG